MTSPDFAPSTPRCATPSAPLRHGVQANQPDASIGEPVPTRSFSPTGARPPAYDAIDPCFSPRLQATQEKDLLLPREMNGRDGSNTSASSAGPSAVANVLTNPIIRGARTVRRALIEEPRLRKQALTQAEVLYRQAQRAQQDGNTLQAVVAYEVAFASFERNSCDRADETFFLLGVSAGFFFETELTPRQFDEQHRAPFLTALRGKNNAELIRCLSTIWARLAFKIDLHDTLQYEVDRYKAMLRAGPCLAWLERHGSEVLSHVARGEDVAATKQLAMLQVGIKALEAPLGNRTTWRLADDGFNEERGLETFNLAEVLLLGAYPEPHDRRKNGLRRLIQLLQEKSCDQAKAFLLRHDEDRMLSNLLLRQQVDKA